VITEKWLISVLHYSHSQRGASVTAELNICRKSILAFGRVCLLPLIAPGKKKVEVS